MNLKFEFSSLIEQTTGFDIINEVYV